MADEHWSERSVLVTGGTGFVASWLVEALLARNARVVALVKEADPGSELWGSDDAKRVHVVYGGTTDEAAVERALLEYEVDTVFHLAAQTDVGLGAKAPFSTLEANVRGTYTVLDVARRHRDRIARFVHASSDKAYGPQEKLPYTEDSPLVGRSPYDVSKSCSDLLAQSYQATYELPLAIARPCNIVGGGDLNWTRLVPGTIKALHAGTRPMIRSDGRTVREYLYVTDAVSAYLALGEAVTQPAHWGEAYNFGPERPVTALEVVEVIARLMDCADLPPRVLGTARHEIDRQFLRAEKARTRLGWRPEHTLEEGLAETIDWYRAHLDGGT